MAEDFNKLRLAVKRMVTTAFKQAWQFRLEIEDAPEDLDIYVKDITYGPTEIETEPEKVGARTLTYPSGAAPVTLSMTIRDHEDERVSKWFDEWAGKVVNQDGTVGVPYGDDGYVKKVKRYRLLSDNTETEGDLWEMFPTQRGDVTESREEGGFLEFPVSFIQFRS